jgi:UDP-N-acetyl-D-glucosamine dehydrogenase
MSINTLLAKVADRSIRIGVIGMGYVGLPLAVEFARKGIHVTGIEANPEKLKRLLAGDSYVIDVDSALLKS